MEKIEVPNIESLKKRFNDALATLPQYYKVIYSDFDRFVAQSLELSVQALEQIAERHMKARRNDYAS